MHTPGNWTVNGQAIVSDQPIGGRDSFHANDAEAVNFYGGHLICESVCEENRAILAAAPKLLDALEALLPWLEYSVNDDVFKRCVLPKAAGRALEQAKEAIRAAKS